MINLKTTRRFMRNKRDESDEKLRSWRIVRQKEEEEEGDSDYEEDDVSEGSNGDFQKGSQGSNEGDKKLIQDSGVYKEVFSDDVVSGEEKDELLPNLLSCGIVSEEFSKKFSAGKKHTESAEVNKQLNLNYEEKSKQIFDPNVSLKFADFEISWGKITEFERNPRNSRGVLTEKRRVKEYHGVG